MWLRVYVSDCMCMRECEYVRVCARVTASMCASVHAYVCAVFVQPLSL